MYCLPPEDTIQALNIADLSVASSWVPSYDPLSPSYDPCAASPCNPFPSSSPFAAVSFARENTRSRLREAFTLHNPPSPPQQPATFSRIPPPHSAPYLRRTKPCRFYLDPSGCKSGRWCNFKHPVGARSEDSKHITHGSPELDELRAAVIRSRTTTAAWDDIPDIRDVDPNWGKKGSPEDDVHPKWRSESVVFAHHDLKSDLFFEPDSTTLPQLSPRVMSLWRQVSIHTRTRLISCRFPIRSIPYLPPSPSPAPVRLALSCTYWHTPHPPGPTLHMGSTSWHRCPSLKHQHQH